MQKNLSHGGWFSKFYLVPKIHKIADIKHKTRDEILRALPFRPIVAAPGSPSYQLQRSLVPLLQSLGGQYEVKTILKDSFDFTQRVHDWSATHQLDPSLTMASYDIDSMYTTTPLRECLEVIRDCINQQKRQIKEAFGFDADTVVELISLCTVVLFISPKGDVLRQNDGFPMGGPIAGPACQLYAEKIEQRALATFPEAPPLLWLRYVDDSFSIMPSASVPTYRDHLNNCDPAQKVRWTFETEHNERLPFLDCLLVRSATGSILIDLYRKPSANSRFIPFDSAHCFRHRALFLRHS